MLHLDETGVRCEKKLHWIHVIPFAENKDMNSLNLFGIFRRSFLVNIQDINFKMILKISLKISSEFMSLFSANGITSSETATFFGLHTKRGSKAVNAIGILPQYRGNVVHDHWHCYFSYQQVKHGLCNVHHLRELKFVHEEENSPWAKEMSDLLLKGKGMVDKAKLEGKKALSQEEIRLIEDEYQRLILMTGHVYIDAESTTPPPEGIGKAGFNLFRRLLKRMGEVLYFVHDLRFPLATILQSKISIVRKF